MAVERATGLAPAWFYPIRFVLVVLTILLFSRQYIAQRPTHPVASIGVGVVVFLVWIGPDILFAYRHHWLFDNRLLGSSTGILDAALRRNPFFLVLRVITSAFLVPVLEELFWRGWLMRWLIERNFQKVPLGTYAGSAFWLVAILFASEHGSYWEVGLLAGVVYNWWIVRTRNLSDCFLAHGVTNGLLAAYVLLAGQWQYWL
jgi:CAAX protease family protein